MRNEALDKNKLNRLVDSMLVEMGEYTDKTYGTAQFHIPDGMYSIEEIEKLLVWMKATEKQTEKSLKRVMKPTKVMYRPADLEALGLTHEDVVNMIKKNT